MTPKRLAAVDPVERETCIRPQHDAGDNNTIKAAREEKSMSSPSMA
jgi:hypothetical protein